MEAADREIKLNKILKIIGFSVVGILVITEAVLAIVVIQSALVPSRYLLIGIGIMLVIAGLVFLLLRKPDKRTLFFIGMLLAVIVCAVSIYITALLSSVTHTISNLVTEDTLNTADIGVYVLIDDEAESISDVITEDFGIMKNNDRANTDNAISLINDQLGVELSTKEFSNIITLIESFVDKETRVIILNRAFIDVVDEIDGYDGFSDGIKELEIYSVEVDSSSFISAPRERNEDNKTASNDNVFAVYLSGIDSRSGLTAYSRSDVNIIAIVNTDTHQILLVSTPRDYYVPLSISDGVRDKLTHAGIYGVGVSMDTLEMLYDIELDYYVRICFDGVVGIVDALGGVNVYSEQAFTNGVYSYQQGYNQVNGTQALSFVRERYAFSDGDRQRGRNQMALINAIIDKAISPEILVNYSSILESIKGNMQMDIPYKKIAGLVSDQLESAAKWNVVTYSVNGTGAMEIPYSMSAYAYVMVPDEETVATAKGLIDQVVNGETISQP